MNGIENITERIKSDAQNEVNQILENAKREADAIEARYAEIAKGDVESILEKGQKSADDRAVRLQGVAGLEARKMILRTKQEMIDLAFHEAESKLNSLQGEEYVKTLASLATSASQTGKEEIILSSADREKYGKEVTTLANTMRAGADNKLSDETREIKGGLVLKDGALEVDASFKTIINQLRDSLSGDVAKIFFG